MAHQNLRIHWTTIVGLAVWGIFPSQLFAQQVKLEGRWWSPLGVVTLSQSGMNVVGRLPVKCAVCPFPSGEEVFKGVLLEDSLTGQIRYCFKGGKDCQGDGWAPLVMLIAREGKVLSGAAHYKATECKVGGKEQGDGVVMRKLKPAPPPTKTTPKPAAVDGGTPGEPGKESVKDEHGQAMEAEVRPADPKTFEKNAGTWRSNMDEAKGFMDNGFFERARKKFFEASELDPTRPEAYNGIGVTYYARGDYEEALNWYKKSLEVNPNFADAYYNMACIYSLQKKLALAFNYLNISALEGFVDRDTAEQDADLNNLRADPQYQEIISKMQKNKSKK
jgi:hypothetical protein